MYGKVFAQTYVGSMFGAGLPVMALWPYMLATCDKKGRVEVNPPMVAVMLGCSADDVSGALDFLAAPDPNSRTKDHEGRRIEKTGQFLYQILNYVKYRDIRAEEERIEYQREWDRAHRPSGAARSKASPTKSPTKSDKVRRGPTSPTKVEVEVEVEKKKGASGGANGHTAVAMFCEAFKACHGENPSRPAIERASKAMKALMEQHGPAIYGAAVTAYFASRDRFVLNERHDPNNFANHFDKYSLTA